MAAGSAAPARCPGPRRLSRWGVCARGRTARLPQHSGHRPRKGPGAIAPGRGRTARLPWRSARGRAGLRRRGGRARAWPPRHQRRAPLAPPSPRRPDVECRYRPSGRCRGAGCSSACWMPASNSSSRSGAKRSTSRCQRVTSCTTMISAFRRAGALPVVIACA